MSALFLELARTVLFLSSSLPHVQIEDDLLNAMVVLAPHGEGAKTLRVVSLPHTSLLCLLMLLLGLNFLPQPLQAKHGNCAAKFSFG